MRTRTFFDKIIGRQRQRERTALTGYQQLVEAVAHQTEPEVEEVERLLADSGKTVEDLQSDCERLARRLGYKAALDRLPALHKERAQLDAQIAAADRALEEAEAAHEEKVRVAGLVTRMRPHQTKTGKMMGFVTLEDVQGNIELVVFPRTWEQYAEAFEIDRVLLIDGKVDAQSGDPKVLVDTVSTELKRVVKEICAYAAASTRDRATSP